MGNSFFQTDVTRRHFWSQLERPDTQELPSRDDFIAFLVKAGPGDSLYREISTHVAASNLLTLQEGPIGKAGVGSVVRYEESRQILTVGKMGYFQSEPFLESYASGIRSSPADLEAIAQWILSLDGSNPLILDQAQEGRRIRYLRSYAGGDQELVLRVTDEKHLAFAFIKHNVSADSPDNLSLTDIVFEPFQKVGEHNWGKLYPNGKTVLLYMLNVGIPALLLIEPINARSADLREILVGHVLTENQILKPKEQLTDAETLDRMIDQLTQQGIPEGREHVDYDEKVFFTALAESPTTKGDTRGAKALYCLIPIGDAEAIQRLDFETGEISVALVETDRRAEFMASLERSPGQMEYILRGLLYVPIKTDKKPFGYLFHPEWGPIVVRLYRNEDGAIVPNYFFSNGDERTKRFLGTQRRNQAPPITAQDLLFAKEFMIPLLAAAAPLSPAELADYILGLPVTDDRVTEKEEKGRVVRTFGQKQDDLISVVRVDGKVVSIGFVDTLAFEETGKPGAKPQGGVSFYPLQAIANGYFGVQHKEYGFILLFMDTTDHTPSFVTRKTVENTLQRMARPVAGTPRIPLVLTEDGKLSDLTLRATARYTHASGHRWFNAFTPTAHDKGTVLFVSDGKKRKPTKIIAKPTQDGLMVYRLSQQDQIELCCVPALDLEAIYYLTLNRPNPRQQKEIRRVLLRLEPDFMKMQEKEGEYVIDHPKVGRIYFRMERVFDRTLQHFLHALPRTDTVAYQNFFSFPPGLVKKAFVEEAPEEGLSLLQKTLLQHTTEWFEEHAGPGVFFIEGHKFVFIKAEEERGVYLITQDRAGTLLGSALFTKASESADDQKDFERLITEIESAAGSSGRKLGYFRVDGPFLTHFPERNLYRVALASPDMLAGEALSIDFFPLTAVHQKNPLIWTDGDHVMISFGRNIPNAVLPYSWKQVNFPLLEWIDGLFQTSHPATLTYMDQKGKQGKIVYLLDESGVMCGLLIQVGDKVALMPLNSDVPEDKKIMDEVQKALLLAKRILSPKVSGRLMARQAIPLNFNNSDEKEMIDAGPLKGEIRLTSEPGKITIKHLGDGGSEEALHFTLPPLLTGDWILGVDAETTPGAFTIQGKTFATVEDERRLGLLTTGPNGKALFMAISKGEARLDQPLKDDLLAAIKKAQPGQKELARFTYQLAALPGSPADMKVFHLTLHDTTNEKPDMVLEMVELDSRSQRYGGELVEPVVDGIRVFTPGKPGGSILRLPRAPSVTSAVLPDPVHLAGESFPKHKPALPEIPIEIGNRTKLRSFFSAAKEPFPIQISIQSSGTYFEEVRAQASVNGLFMNIKWGGDEATPMRFAMSGRKGDYTLESAEPLLPGKIRFIDEPAKGRKVFIVETGSPLALWLDTQLYGPALKITEEKQEGPERSLMIRGEPFSELFRSVYQIWQAPSGLGKLSLKDEGEEWGINVSFPSDKAKEVAHLIDQTAELYRQSLSGKRKPLWNVARVVNLEPVAKVVTRSITVPSIVDSQAVATIDTSFDRVTLGGEVQSVAFRSIKVRGQTFPAEGIEINHQFERLALGEPIIEFPITLSISRRTSIPPGRELFNLVLYSGGHQEIEESSFEIRMSDGSFSPVKVEKKKQELPLSKEIEGTPKMEWETLFFRKPDGTLAETVLFEPMLRGKPITQGALQVTVVGITVSDSEWPLVLGAGAEDLDVVILREASKKGVSGWETLYLIIKNNGKHELVAESFVSRKEKTRTQTLEVAPFTLTFQTLDHPQKGRLLTAVELTMDDEMARMLGLKTPFKLRPEGALPVVNDQEFQLSFSIRGIDSVLIKVAAAEGGFALVGQPPLAVPALWDISGSGASLTLQGLLGGAGDHSTPAIALDSVASINGRRFFIPEDHRQQFLTLLKWTDPSFVFDPNRHTAIEVGQAEDNIWFEPVRKTEFAVPVNAISLPKGFLSSQDSFLHFQAGETFVPSQGTLNWLKNAFSDKLRVPQLTPGSLYWYELESTRTGLILRLPVLWRPDRKNCFELDSSRPPLAYLKGEDVSKALPIRDKRWRAYDDGGEWNIYFLSSDLGPKRAKAFHLNAVVSEISPLIIGAANILDEKGEERSRDDYRQDAKKARDVRIKTHFDRKTKPEPFFVSGASAQIGEDRRVSFKFGDGKWQLEGMLYDADRKRIVLDDELLLQTPDETITLQAFELCGGPPGQVRLSESAFQKRNFIWNVALGTLAVPEENQVPLMDVGYHLSLAGIYYKSAATPRLGTATTAGKTPTLVQTAEGADTRVSVLPAELQGVIYPAPDRIRQGRDVDARTVTALQGQVFLPAEESLYAQLLNGRGYETMTFISSSGAILQIPMELKPDSAARYRADMGPTSRLLIPDPDKPGFYINLPAVFNAKNLRGGAQRIELLVGKDQVLSFERGSTTQTINKRPAFGLFALNSGNEVDVGRARINAGLREWLEFLGLDDGNAALPATFAGGGIDLSLSSEKHVHLYLSQKMGTPFQLDGILTDEITRETTVLYDEVGQEGGGLRRMKIYRAPGGASLYYLQDEMKNVFTMAIEDNGKISFRKRPPRIGHFLTIPVSPAFKMVTLEGKTYDGDATSAAFCESIEGEDGNRLFVIRAALGRSEGATERSIIFDGGNPKIVVQLEWINGELTANKEGEIKEEGKGKRLLKADVEMVPWEEGKIRIYVRGRDFRQQGTGKNYRDYAWLEFDSKEKLIDHFEVSLAHYNRTNMAAKQLMPSEAHDFLKFPRNRNGRKRTPIGVPVTTQAGTSAQVVTTEKAPGSGGTKAHSSVLLGGASRFMAGDMGGAPHGALVLGNLALADPVSLAVAEDDLQDLSDPKVVSLDHRRRQSPRFSAPPLLRGVLARSSTGGRVFSLRQTIK